MRHVLRIGAVVALVAGGLAITSAPAGAAVVSSEAQLRTAFAGASESLIVLAADITLTDCSAAGGALDRPIAGVEVTVDGGGHTVRQTCTDQGVFAGGNRYQNITIAGGTVDFVAQNGAAIDAAGPLFLTNVVITDNRGGPPFAPDFTSAAVRGTVLHIDSSTFRGNFVSGFRASEAGSTITNSTFGPNFDSAWGGGLIGAGTVSDSVFTGNEGGGLALGDPNKALTIVERTTIVGNGGTPGLGSGSGLGSEFGGIISGTKLRVVASTITGNWNRTFAGLPFGGGISTVEHLTIVNSTISFNRSQTAGGGVTARTLDLQYATILANFNGETANVLVYGTAPGPGLSRFTSYGSVIGSPLGGGASCDIAGATRSQGYNFSDDGSCGFSGPGDRSSGDPLLGPLADNGGPTQTHLPLSGSPLIDAIPSVVCANHGITTDQRGVSRPQGAACDIGAVEVNQALAGVMPTFTG